MVKPMVFNSSLNEEELENFNNHIYIENEGKIYEYEIRFAHMSVVDALEKYINNEKIYNLMLVNEKQAKSLETPLKFLPHMGKFRLPNNFFRTDNYLTPNVTYLLNFLNKKYYDNNITSKDLSALHELKEKFESEGRKEELEIIEDLCYGIRVSLVNEYDFNESVSIKIIEGMEKLNVNENFKVVLEKMKELIFITKENKKCIKGLKIKDDLLNPIYEQEKQKRK